jgi:hypothetical protein
MVDAPDRDHARANRGADRCDTGFGYRSIYLHTDLGDQLDAEPFDPSLGSAAAG